MPFPLCWELQQLHHRLLLLARTICRFWVFYRFYNDFDTFVVSTAGAAGRSLGSQPLVRQAVTVQSVAAGGC